MIARVPSPIGARAPGPARPSRAPPDAAPPLARTGSPPDLPGPDLAARWLSAARRAALGAQLVVTLLAEAGTDLHLHSPALFALMGAWLALDLSLAARLGAGRVGERTLVVAAFADLLFLTGLLMLAGGHHSPLLFGYLAFLVLFAMVLPAPVAWAAALVAALCQAFVVWAPFAAAHPDPHSHLFAHMFTFDLAAAGITWMVTHLSAALRERGAQARREAERREATERLAALGGLAAGVAHELGTPLGTIQLLAEEARSSRGEAGDAGIDALLTQVARCRALLDRLRGRDTPGAAEGRAAVGRWVEEWRNAAPEPPVEVVGAADEERVLGGEEGWRAALWVALDNARSAGAKRVEVGVTQGEEAVVVRVDDDGAGLAPGAAEHAGEPFWTGWQGTGLGLFVSRRFAETAGGAMTLEPRPGGGARTTLVLPRAARRRA